MESNFIPKQIRFAECRSFNYHESSFSINTGKYEKDKWIVNKKWRMLIDPGKHIYIYEKYHIPGKDGFEVKLIFELETVIKDDVNRYKIYELNRSNDERNKKRKFVKEVAEISLVLAGDGSNHEHYFILSKDWLSQERLDCICNEIKYGRCNRATQIDFQIDKKVENKNLINMSWNNQFYRDSGTLDPNDSRLVILVDFIDLAQHLHANFIKTRTAFLNNITIGCGISDITKLPTSTMLEDRTIKQLIYNTLRNAEEEGKLDQNKKNKFKEYINCLQNGKVFYEKLKAQFEPEEILYSQMEEYARQLCSVLRSIEFKSAFNDYLFGCVKYYNTFFSKAYNIYSELIFQLETTKVGAKYLDTEFINIENEFDYYNDESSKKEVGSGYNLNHSPVVKLFRSSKQPVDAIYGIIAEYKVPLMKKGLESAIKSGKGQFKYRETRINYFTEAQRILSGGDKTSKYVSKQFEEILKNTVNNKIKTSVEQYRKEMEFLKNQIENNETKFKALKLTPAAGLGCRIMLHGLCLVASLENRQQLAITYGKDNLDLAGDFCDVLEPVLKGFELGSKTMKIVTFFNRASLITGVIGGTIDAVVNVIEAGEQGEKGNNNNRYANYGMAAGNSLLVAGSLLLLVNPLVGAVFLGIGALIWVICKILDDYVFKKYDEMKVWLRHCKYGVCFFKCKESGCPKLTTDCKPDASVYKWTRYRVGKKKITTLNPKKIFSIEYAGEEVEVPVYSDNYWFKSASEHSQAYGNLLKEALN